MTDSTSWLAGVENEVQQKEKEHFDKFFSNLHIGKEHQVK